MKKVIATWSGGKDSSLACFQAMKAGYDIAYLANTISKEHKRVRFHGVENTLIQKQSESIGIPLLQKETTAESYEKEFKDNLQKGLSDGIDGVVFGDIHLQECLAWAKKVCKDLAVEAIEPLWGRRPDDVFLDFIQSGFEAIVVSTQANLLGKEWVGRKLDKSFLKDIQKIKKIDSCGENGEFHTFVIDGPIFKQRVELKESRKILRDGYWFLDISEYQMSLKNLT